MILDRKIMRVTRLLVTPIAIVSLVAGCGVREKMEKHNKARANADFIMENLNQPDISNQFPEKFFPKDRFQPFLDTLTKHCDFNSKKGKFVDFFNMNINGKSQTAYIHEYILNCDGIRFIYVYDFDKKGA